jgi:hypothetical protein
VVVSQLGIHQSWIDESLSSVQMVVGSVLGAFLGFSISQKGVLNGDYNGLFFLLFWISAFIGLSINWARHYFKLGWRMIVDSAVVLALLSGFAFMSRVYADHLGLDGKTLLTIEGTWMVLIVIEVIGSFYHRRRYKND